MLSDMTVPNDADCTTTGVTGQQSLIATVTVRATARAGL